MDKKYSRYLHESGYECAEAESFDDEGTKVANASVRDIAHYPKEEQEVKLDV